MDNTRRNYYFLGLFENVRLFVENDGLMLSEEKYKLKQFIKDIKKGQRQSSILPKDINKKLVFR